MSCLVIQAARLQPRGPLACLGGLHLDAAWLASGLPQAQWNVTGATSTGQPKAPPSGYPPVFLWAWRANVPLDTRDLILCFSHSAGMIAAHVRPREYNDFLMHLHGTSLGKSERTVWDGNGATDVSY